MPLGVEKCLPPASIAFPSNQVWLANAMKRSSIATADTRFCASRIGLHGSDADAAPRVDYTLRACASDKTRRASDNSLGGRDRRVHRRTGHPTDQVARVLGADRPGHHDRRAGVRAVADKRTAHRLRVWAHGKRPARRLRIRQVQRVRTHRLTTPTEATTPGPIGPGPLLVQATKAAQALPASLARGRRAARRSRANRRALDAAAPCPRRSTR